MAKTPVYGGEEEMSQLIVLNGQIVEVEEANVSVLDRANLFGDGLYEVIRCYTGGLFEHGTHVERLLDGAAALGITHDWTGSRWSRQPGDCRLRPESWKARCIFSCRGARRFGPTISLIPSRRRSSLTLYPPVRPIPPDACTAGTSVITCP